jgi:hypothetical protein
MEVSVLLGHSSVQVTEQRYASLPTESQPGRSLRKDFELAAVVGAIASMNTGFEITWFRPKIHWVR